MCFADWYMDVIIAVIQKSFLPTREQWLQVLYRSFQEIAQAMFPEIRYYLLTHGTLHVSNSRQYTKVIR